MTHRSLVVFAAIAALFGCHNTDLPDVSALGADGGGVGPVLALNGSAHPQVSLSTVLSFEASDVDGVRSVSLDCGGYPLASWQSPPYQAAVDLTPCRGFAAPEAGKPGFLTLTLSLWGTDRLGNQSRFDFPVEIDATTAALSTDLPATLAPGAPIDFAITADRPLKAPPLVHVGDEVAQVSVDPGTPNRFLVHFDAAPGLSADAGLDATETLVAVRVDATAQNGNPTHLDLTLRLSRVLWTRSLLTGIETTAAGASPVLTPTLTPAGLVLALTDAVPDRPGIIDPTSGALSPVNPNPADVAGAGLNWITATGGFAYNDGGTIVLVDSQSAATTVIPNTGFIFASNVQRVDDGLAITSSQNCNAGSLTTVNYVSPASTTVKSKGLDAGTNSNPKYAASKGTLAIAQADDCSVTGTLSAWLTYTPSTDSSYYETQDPLHPSCTYAGPSSTPVGNFQLTAGTDGTFALRAVCNDGTTDAFLADTAGNHLGAYYGPTPGTAANDTFIGLHADHRLLTWESTNPGTIFRSWPSDGGAPVVASISETFSAIDALIDRFDGGVDLLVTAPLGSATQSFAILQLGSDLQPRWVYRYPTVYSNSPSTTVPWLIGDDARDAIYLVNANDAVLMAFQR